jgi:hypothetical protein
MFLFSLGVFLLGKVLHPLFMLGLFIAITVLPAWLKK